MISSHKFVVHPRRSVWLVGGAGLKTDGSGVLNLSLLGEGKVENAFFSKPYLSPEQVSGYLKQHHALSLSHETIYRFIYSDETRQAE